MLGGLCTVLLSTYTVTMSSSLAKLCCNLDIHIFTTYCTRRLEIIYATIH